MLFAKLLNLFRPEGKKLNPMIGAAGISAFPMSGRVVNKMGLEEDNQNFLLMYSISVNVSGQIASVIAGGLTPDPDGLTEVIACFILLRG